MNILEEVIAKVTAEEDRDEMKERLLQRLLDKQQELGADASEQEAQDATKEVFLAYMRDLMSAQAAQEADDEVVWDEQMEDAMDAVRGALRKAGWRFWEYSPQAGVRTIEMGTSEDDKRLQVKIYLEAEVKDCRIDVIFPFAAEKVLAYPLCEKLMEECYPRRFGALCYDSRDGELSYRYSFPIMRGLDEEEFEKIFMMVMLSAYASYDTVRQYAMGRFSKAERSRIIRRAQNLIIELDR